MLRSTGITNINSNSNVGVRSAHMNPSILQLHTLSFQLCEYSLHDSIANQSKKIGCLLKSNLRIFGNRRISNPTNHKFSRWNNIISLQSHGNLLFLKYYIYASIFKQNINTYTVLTPIPLQTKGRITKELLTSFVRYYLFSLANL